HIPDDRRAMSEMFRVLRPGGELWVSVPVVGESTYEDWSKQTPQERIEAFLQYDHVRIYGLDIADRLASVGFSVEVLSTEQLPPEDVTREGLATRRPTRIFLCRKREAGDRSAQ
ncbi:MAG: hypothetical protein AAF586_11225, partial [Planctomycetota bacterium]